MYLSPLEKIQMDWRILHMKPTSRDIAINYNNIMMFCDDMIRQEIQEIVRENTKKL